VSLYESHNLQDRELPFIYKEHVARSAEHTFGSSNWHENVEIVYVSKGQGAISNNGHTLLLREGDIAVINANHLHSFAATDGEMIYRYLIVDRSFCLANGVDTNAVSFEMRIEDEQIRELMELLHAEYSSENTSYRTLKVRSIVLRLLARLCEAHSTPIEAAERLDHSVSYVKQAIDYVRASYGKDFSLDEVAAFVGVSKCYLSREFHKYTGYTFVAYVNRMRCKMAQQLLSDTRISVSEVGRRCGFANRSYFAKSFRRYVGMLPIEYRAQALSKS